VNLSDGRRRNAALEVCLAEECTMLATRMEDGIVEPRHARQIIDWAFDHLWNSELTRVLQGRLLNGVGRPLRLDDDPDYVYELFHAQLNPLPVELGPVGDEDERQCGRCFYASGTCRFVHVMRCCGGAFLFRSADPYTKPSTEQVGAFLPGYRPDTKRGRGRPAQDFYGELLHAGYLDDDHGASRIAQVRRVEGNSSLSVSR
jgi:hypothetical protein